MKLRAGLILIIFLLVVLQFGFIKGLSSVNVNFDIKDQDGIIQRDSLVIVQGITNTAFSESKLTDSNGKASFTLNKNEIFIYIVYKLSYKEQTGNIFTSGDKNIQINLQKLPDDQWFFYRLNNGEIELQFKSLDEDTNYVPGDYMKEIFEIRNVAGRNIQLTEKKSLYQVVDSQTLNILRAWGNLNPSDPTFTIDVTLKADGWIKGTLSEGKVEVCGGNLIINYAGQNIELSGDESICKEDLQDNRIPSWILKNNYKIKFDYIYNIDGVEKQINFTSQDFFINNTDWIPEIVSFPEINAGVGERWNYTLVLKDYDESFSKILDKVNYKLLEAPLGMTIDENLGFLEWVPSENGNHDVVVRVYYEYFENNREKIAYNDQRFTLNVTGAIVPNNPPTITSMPITQVNESNQYIYDVEAMDSDNDSLIYSLTASLWLSIDSSTGLITGMAPNVSSDTLQDLIVSVSDGTNSTSQAFSLIVKNIEILPPVDTIPPVITVFSPTNNQQFNFSYITLNITSDEALSGAWFSLDNLPNVGLNQVTLTNFDLIYNFSDGNHSIIFYARDLAGNIGQTIAINFSVDTRVIIPPDTTPPLISVIYPLNSVNYTENVTSFNYTATDTNLDSCWFSLDKGLTNVKTICNVPITNILSNYGTNTWTIYANDTSGNSAFQEVGFIIDMPAVPNNPPTITSMPITQVNESNQYIYDVEAMDSDNDSLIYSLTAPSWLSIDSSTGLITGMAPNVSSDTLQNLIVSVSDGTNSTSQAFSLMINQINNAPGINSIAITSVEEGGDYLYFVNASDIDGDNLGYSLTSSPDWLSINSSTGMIYGTAPRVKENTEFNVAVLVSDSSGGIAIQNYVILVKEVLSTESKSSKKNVKNDFINKFYEDKYFEQLNLPKTTVLVIPGRSLPGSSLKNNLEIKDFFTESAAITLLILNLGLGIIITLVIIKKFTTSILINKVILQKK